MTRPQQRTNRGPALTAALATVLLTGCGGGASDAAPQSPPEKGGPPVAVTVLDLTKEYRADAAAADAKYKGKVIEFEGVVYVPPVGAAAQVLLKDPADRDDARSDSLRWICAAGLREKARALKPGQKVKVRGKVFGASGTEGTRFVDVVEGEFIDVGPPPKD